jgi:hypothetical protein
MDIGPLLAILFLIGYVMLYLGGRYYLREDFQSGGYSVSNPLGESSGFRIM